MTNLARAQEWTRLELTRVELTRRQEELRGALGQCQNDLEKLVKELRATLDATVPQRLFDVGDGRVVMVTSVRGVELVTVERADLKVEVGGG